MDSLEEVNVFDTLDGGDTGEREDMVFVNCDVDSKSTSKSYCSPFVCLGVFCICPSIYI